MQTLRGRSTFSRRLGKKYPVVPAQAGIHRELNRAHAPWIPACAGTTGGVLQPNDLPTQYPDDAKNSLRGAAAYSSMSSSKSFALTTVPGLT